jgi:hypothetical protein
VRRKPTGARHHLAVRGKWVVEVDLWKYNKSNQRHYGDAEAGAFIRRIAAKALGVEIGPPPDTDGPDCGKAGALTRHLQALRAHQAKIAGIDQRLKTMLAEPEPDPRKFVAIGREALEKETCRSASPARYGPWKTPATP